MTDPKLENPAPAANKEMTMTDRLTTARANLDAARTEFHAAALAALNDCALGLYWVGEDTEVFVATSADAIRAAGLAADDDHIEALPEPQEAQVEVLIEAMETCLSTLLHGPYQLWSAYAE